MESVVWSSVYKRGGVYTNRFFYAAELHACRLGAELRDEGERRNPKIRLIRVST